MIAQTPAFATQEEQDEAIARLVGSFGYGGEQPYHPKPDYPCPLRGTIHWTNVPYARARELVEEANEERTRRRNLDEPSVVSEAEVVMLAALLYYGEMPRLQYPVGPYDLDFVITDYQAAIEVDGHAFHDRKRDKRRDTKIKKQAGITVHRVTAEDVFKDPFWVSRNVCRDIYQDTQRRRETPCHTS